MGALGGRSGLLGLLVVLALLCASSRGATIHTVRNEIAGEGGAVNSLFLGPRLCAAAHPAPPEQRSVMHKGATDHLRAAGWPSCMPPPPAAAAASSGCPPAAATESGCPRPLLQVITTECSFYFSWQVLGD